MESDPDTSETADRTQVKPAHTHLHELFVETARSIHRYIPLQRAILVVARDHYRDLIAVAGWGADQGGATRTLSLALPVENSLFAEVAGQRFGFTDDYFGLFSGNSIERRLLIDSRTHSYVIWPLRVEASVVGLVGLSSEYPGAFTEIEAIDPERTLAPLAGEMARLRAQHYL
ncbi:MAG: hypothetical protein HY851_07055 [candidate division Zixibacteria bacterium]|nr:hypothetical protein [candidate division Zixibacteria bacterium]